LNDATKALERLRLENESLRGKIINRNPGGIVGSSASIKQVFDILRRVGPSDANVLVIGETGTGKELVARAIHEESVRRTKPFIAINCAGLSDTLADSELFGHTRGAFTGALANHVGVFGAADSGTLFLDEVGELSLATQAKLLRVLQERELRRVGETKDTKIDVRVVAATNRDLEHLVREGSFREDLFYRLASFVIRTPPLRDRREDISDLAAHFLSLFAARHERQVLGLSPEAVASLEAYDWPGNVRQLQHTIERIAIVHANDGVIDLEAVQSALYKEPALAPIGNSVAMPLTASLDAPISLDLALLKFEQEMVTRALSAAKGVIADAARALGMNRSTLSRRCKRLGIRI
jgi:transcriptional regulator with GAF, ATPase, and Fis domain